MSDLIDAANKHAAWYDDDDRQDIRADVMNAFFAGAKFGGAAKSEAQTIKFVGLNIVIDGSVPEDEVRIVQNGKVVGNFKILNLDKSETKP